jgi:fatty-acyl-CoA synthase
MTERPIIKPAQAWARAIELTAAISRQPSRILPTVIGERAAQLGEAPALISERECLTYRGLVARANQYARWALAQNLAKGDCVGLFLSNQPDFLAIWLGITQVGGVVALLNTNLAGLSLDHCINLVAPKHLIASAEIVDRLAAVQPQLSPAPTVWIHSGDYGSFQRLDQDVEHHGAEPLAEAEHRPVTIEDRALYIYTSGTTGLPKAAAISHGRVMQWSHWFAGMMDTRPTDRMYNCLPMYHSVGGVQAPGAMLATGGSVVLREKFSAGRFWSDIIRWDCSLFQYIGELCRYLLHTDPSLEETQHHLRMACGNGLRPDIWNSFQERFRIPQILEFYAATEGNVSLFNVEGEPGAIGRIPPYLAHRFPASLVKFDVEKGEPVRDEHGFCVGCAPNEVGELIGPLSNDSSNFGGRFEGYTSKEASTKKILRGVFKPGDAWFRTGDLMRKDGKGFFYFVDRIGDTFRWKGENVSTTEVSEALCAFPGIREARVYGVEIPGSDGRAGMATIIIDGELNLTAFRAYLIDRLPDYARPIFLRIRHEMDVTATFKYTTTDLVRQGYDPVAIVDAIYFHDLEREAFIRLDKPLYDRIQEGQVHQGRRQPAVIETGLEVGNA